MKINFILSGWHYDRREEFYDGLKELEEVLDLKFETAELKHQFDKSGKSIQHQSYYLFEDRSFDSRSVSVFLSTIAVGSISVSVMETWSLTLSPSPQENSAILRVNVANKVYIIFLFIFKDVITFKLTEQLA